MSEWLASIKARFLIFCLAGLFFSGCKATAPALRKKPSVLLFCLTKGYHHASITDGIQAFQKMAGENGFILDTTTNVDFFTSKKLGQYAAVVFLSPTGTNVFNNEQKQALRSYLRQGGGVLGIHAATDFCYEWEWYGQMIGAFFLKHPKIQEAKLHVVLPENEMNLGLPKIWSHKDEWYNFKSVNSAVKVLIKIDETSYIGGSMDNNHPVSWYHKFDGGRVFYTALGHTKECYTDPLFLGHVLAGLRWTMKR